MYDVIYKPSQGQSQAKAKGQAKPKPSSSQGQSQAKAKGEAKPRPSQGQAKAKPMQARPAKAPAKVSQGQEPSQARPRRQATTKKAKPGQGAKPRPRGKPGPRRKTTALSHNATTPPPLRSPVPPKLNNAERSATRRRKGMCPPWACHGLLNTSYEKPFVDREGNKDQRASLWRRCRCPV